MKKALALGRSASVEGRGLRERAKPLLALSGLHWEERLKMIDFHYLSLTFELAGTELS